jgi:thymidylate synthase
MTWASREANPYFHLYEALWMLAGCQNVSQLTYFNKRMAEFSDDGKTLPASYGWRWRNYFEVDQIEATIQNIIKNPNDRRLVIGMFDPRHDVLTQRETKDVPCNISIKFRVMADRLDMIVFNRSNDIIWGAYGANAVHMSFLQEYIAHASGLKVGNYWQISSDFHAYQPLFDEKLGGMINERIPDPHEPSMVLFPVGDKLERDRFDADLQIVFDIKPEFLHLQESEQMTFSSKFFRSVIVPMLQSHHHIKMKEFDKAMSALDPLEKDAPDWREACFIWISARRASAERKDKQ